jgi:hypothetical protein
LIFSISNSSFKSVSTFDDVVSTFDDMVFSGGKKISIGAVCID